MGFDWKGTLATVAPSIATAIGGPMGGVAARIALDALGIEAEGDSEKQLEKFVTFADPSILLQLKKAEHSFQVEMKRLDIDFKKVSADDRDSARKREMEVKDRTPQILAFMLLITYAFVQSYFLMYDIPVGNKDFILRSLGTMDGILIAMITYYFGSSNK